MWSLTLVPRSLLLNRTETLATQARETEKDDDEEDDDDDDDNDD